MEDTLYGPTFAFFATIICLNIFQCAFGIRRVRQLERRIWVLENTSQTTTTNTNETQSQIQRPVNQPVYSYVQPPVYTYYQQPSAPSATPYYPQDPQIIPTPRNY